MEIFTLAGLWALGQVIFTDLVMAGDNAIVIGLAAAGLPAEQRKKAILVGIIAATVLRIGFAAVAAQLLAIDGLKFVGGLLLVWVCWKMWVELRSADHNAETATSAEAAAETRVDKTFAQAAMQIVIADVSMSLDNVLVVASVAQDHTTVLIIGLVLSIALMGLAANFVAQMLHRHRWIAYVGLAVIVYVTAKMLYEGGHELLPVIQQWMA